VQASDCDDSDDDENNETANTRDQEGANRRYAKTGNY
jgi:hypothetical protein